MGGAVSKRGALVLLFGFVCVSIIVSLLSLLYFISIANFWWLVKGFERKRWESWFFLCFGEVGGKDIYFIGVLEGLREMEMRKKRVQSSTPIGYLKRKNRLWF